MLFSGLGVAVLSLLLLGFPRFLVRKLRQRRAKPEISIEKQTRFYRMCPSHSDNTDKDTVIVVHATIRNNIPDDIVIAKYGLKILSPRKYRSKITQLAPAIEKLRYRVAEDRSSGLGLPPDPKRLIPAGSSEPSVLFFRFPIIIKRGTNKLECKLGIRLSNGHKAFCKCIAEKDGY